MFQIGTFYKCFEFSGYKELEDSLRDYCSKRKIKGTIILTPEGVNATVSSERERSLAELNEFLNDSIGTIKFRFSISDISPFKRLKIKKRQELVPSGTKGRSFDHQGNYLTPLEWSNFVEDPNNIIIDVRNDYENKVGTFKNSISPDTKNFREFKDFVNQNPELPVVSVSLVSSNPSIVLLNKNNRWEYQVSLFKYENNQGNMYNFSRYVFSVNKDLGGPIVYEVNPDEQLSRVKRSTFDKEQIQSLLVDTIFTAITAPMPYSIRIA